MSTNAFAQGSLPVESASIAELQEALGNGAITVREIVQACLDRIAAHDQQGPALNAVIELNPDALTIADELDAELAAGTTRSPIHGTPVLLKDNVATLDAMQATAGSLALEGLQPTEESSVARFLRGAGAVILGKTNLSEWANIRSYQATSGWSGRGGQTVNPYQLDRNASGSSSGSGAAVAAGYVPVAIGTETNGSIVSPASHCGIVGIKPTVGLVSRWGVIPISHSQDTVGPMARSVADAAAVLTAIAIQDDSDPAQGGVQILASPAATPEASPVATPEAEAGTMVYTGSTYPPKPEGGVPVVDYTAELDPNGLQGARIGVLRSAAGFSPLTDRVFEESLATMTAAGAELVEVAGLPSDEERNASPDGLNVLLWELKSDLADWFATFLPVDAPIKTLADVIAFNEANADREMPYFDQSLFLQAEGMGGVQDPEYAAAVERIQRWGRAEGIDAVLQEHRLDALVAPTNSPATKIDLVNGDHFIGGSSTPAAIAGYPIITVPAGAPFGLPVGISFIGTAWSEATLVRLAYAFEQQTNAFFAPGFLPGAVLPPVASDPDAATPVT